MPTFILYDFFAALIPIPISVYLAYRFGEDIEQGLRYVRRSQWIGFTLVAAVAAFFVIRWLRRRARERREAAAATGAGGE